MPQLQEGSEDFIFQQDGAPSHFILTYVLTSMLIFQVVGVAVLLTMTLLFFSGLHGDMT
jgi:hypothetical protein